ARARDALLAHEQQQLGLPGKPQAEQRSQAADKCSRCGASGPERQCPDCPDWAADPPRDDLVRLIRMWPMQTVDGRKLLADAADRIERDAQDAKRYRWLRIMWWNFGSSNYPVPSKFGGKEFWSHLDAFAAVDTPDKLNAAIDAAMGAADEGGK